MKILKTISLYNYLIIITLIVCFISLIRINNIKTNKLETNITGVILDYKIKQDKIDLIIKNKNKKIKCSYYNIENNKKIKYGAIINLVTKEINPTNNTIPNTFNYKKYLKSINIYNTCTIKKIKNIKKSNNIIFKIKNIINNRIMNIDKKGYLQTLILSNKNIDEDTYNNYKKLGIIHLFSISGMHISLLAIIISTILNKINKSNINIFLVILFLLFYMIITNYSPSIVRSIILYILININKLLKFNIENKSIILITINIILIINPNFIINIGFLYSSIISFSLIRFKNILKKTYFINLLFISIISLLISLPITINLNYEINILSILSNLLFVPLIAFIIYPLSLIVLILPSLYNLFNVAIIVLESIVLLLNKINIFTVIIPHLNIYYIVIYYIILYLTLTKNIKYIIILFALLLTNKYKYLIDNNYYIYYLDVGQGDMNLIKYKDQSIIIDTGPKNEYTQNSILLFIKSLGINNIDYLITTHGDNDHVGNVIYLVNNIKIKKVVFNKGDYNKEENMIIDLLNKKNIKYYNNIKVLNIKKQIIYFLNTNIYDNENDNSNVIYFINNNKKFIFMGDAGIQVEKDIINKYNITNIDFLKVGHHGSNTSTDKKFINAIKPSICLISVGKNNYYGHPKDSVLKTLNKCNIYRTDLDGSIEIKLNNKRYNIKNTNP